MKDIFKKFTYDLSKYNFRSYIEEVFQSSDLENLHLKRPELLPKKELKFENESQTDFHSIFYQKLNSPWTEFIETYKKFIKNEIATHFNEEIIFQSLPSFRAQIPNDQAVHKWHTDSDHDHNHPLGEINYCIAITDMIETSTIWIESEPQKKDFKPMNIKLGEYHRFNGNQCLHGNKRNITNKMRFSLDFRVLPRSKYSESEIKLSATAGRKFAVNHYYSELKL